MPSQSRHAIPVSGASHFAQGTEAIGGHRPYECDLVRNVCYSGSPFEDAMSRELVHHYDRYFAPQMVWVDSEDNPFRKIIIPLALQSPALMMSIFSVAAGDLWSRRNNPASHQPWAEYQQHTLALLTKHLQAANDEGPMVSYVPTTDHPSTILAAFLLGSMGLRIGKSGDWRLHLRAAWTMIEHWSSTSQSAFFGLESIKEFLLQELYFYKVWDSITTFRPLDEFSTGIFNLNDQGPFVQYTGIIRRLAEIERREGEMRPGVPCELSIPLLQNILDEARKRTKRYGISVTFASAAVRLAFEQVADLFHHAGILYGCHVLARDQCSGEAAAISRQQLFRILKEITITRFIAQDLPWPVFVAGTECQGDLQNQQLVEARMKEIMQLSGTLERPRVLGFLRQLWHLQAQSQCSGWISLARIWAAKGEPILLL